MDFDEGYQLNEEARIQPNECDVCGGEIAGYEAIDPFIIDDMILCDKCASDLMALRMDGYLSVSEKTKRL